jgi:putative transposase
MPYWRLFYHFVWTTRCREPLIAAEFEEIVRRVVAAKAVSLDAIVHAVAVIEDHIHLAASVPPRLALSEFVGQVKGNSSHWANHAFNLPCPFAWQGDYGVVSFGGKQLDMVLQYLKNQRPHHQRGTCLQFLERIETDGAPETSP